jgi:hypothetical protein
MNKKKRFQSIVYATLLYGALFIGGCASALGRHAPGQPMTTIFPAEETRRFLPLLGRCDPTGLAEIDSAWSPSDRDAAPIAQVLRAALTDSSGSSFPGYRLQYFGIMRGTTRLILVNAFHEDVIPTSVESKNHADQEWTTTPFIFCDGGRLTFQVEYNVASQRLGAIRFGPTIVIADSR